jgi:hypothetical protein
VHANKQLLEVGELAEAERSPKPLPEGSTPSAGARRRHFRVVCSLTTPQWSRHTLALGRPEGEQAARTPMRATTGAGLGDAPSPGTGGTPLQLVADAADGEAAALSMRRTGFDSRIGRHAPVAQQDRVCRYERQGPRFDSWQGYSRLM